MTAGAPGSLVGNVTMHALADFFPALAESTALLLVALAAAPLAARIRVPGPAAFLFVGVIAGRMGMRPFDVSIDGIEQVGVIALYIILFQGGLATGYAAWRSQARPILLLGLPGTALTAGALAVTGRLIGLDWDIAVLVGVALAPTDPAAVYSIMRGRSAGRRARTILEGESGFNDPVAISMMVVAIAALGADGASFADSAGKLGLELGIGLAGGVLGGLGLRVGLTNLRFLDHEFRAVAFMLGAIVVGATTAALHGSGFLAVYLAALLISDQWQKLQSPGQLPLPEALSAAAEPLLFGVLGALFAPLVGAEELAYGLVFTLVTVLLVRPVVVTAALFKAPLDPGERSIVSWGGFKGAVPLLLAGFPALESLDDADRVAAIVLSATAASVLIQGATLAPFADRALRANGRGRGPARWRQLGRT